MGTPSVVVVVVVVPVSGSVRDHGAQTRAPWQ
jgi:hypothetical protein